MCETFHLISLNLSADAQTPMSLMVVDYRLSATFRGQSVICRFHLRPLAQLRNVPYS
jgi:hypothetical protein